MPSPPLPMIAAAGRYDGDATVFMHAHPCPELLLVETGDLQIEVPDLGFSCGVPAGAMLILPARHDHRHTGHGRASTAWILLRSGSCALDDRPRVLPLPADDPARTWFFSAVDLHRSGDANGVPHLVAALLERVGASERYAVRHAAQHPAVVRAQRLIWSEPSRPWSLAALARGSGVAGPYLAALFRAQIGCTPLQFQTRLRLAIADRLLADPYRGVAAVARELGMESNYFCRLFRRHRGRSPAVWRARDHGDAGRPEAR